MPDKAPPWTESEDQIVISLWTRYRGIDIAAMMKRSQTSVYRRAARLGLVSKGYCRKIIPKNGGMSASQTPPGYFHDFLPPDTPPIDEPPRAIRILAPWPEDRTFTEISRTDMLLCAVKVHGSTAAAARHLRGEPEFAA